jgi:hypothetical protein
MKKRFNIKLTLESEAPTPTLEVEKEAIVATELTPEEKAVRDAKLLETEVDQAEADKAKEEGSSDSTSDDATDTTVDVDETPADESDETKAQGDKDAVVNTEETEQEPPAELPEDQDGTETDIASMAEDEKASDEDKEDVSKAKDAVAGMEAIAEQMRESLQFGGMTTSTAKTTSFALENLYKQAGLTPRKNKVFPAMESFEFYSAREKQTQLAIEGVEDAVGRVWNAISGSLSKTTAKIKDLMSKFLFMFKTYEGQIKKLRDALSKCKSDTPRRDQFSDKHVIKNLTTDGSFDAIEGLKSGNVFLSKVLKTTRTTTKENLAIIKNSFGTAIFSEMVSKVPRLKMSNNDILPGLVKNPHGSDKEHLEHFVYSALPGGIQVECELPKASLSDIEYISAIGESYFTTNTHGSTGLVPNEVAIADRKDIKDILDECEALLNVSSALWLEMDRVTDSSDSVSIWKMFEHLEDQHERKTQDPRYYSNSTSVFDVRKAFHAYMEALDSVSYDMIISSCNKTNRILSAGISYSDACVRAYV